MKMKFPQILEDNSYGKEANKIYYDANKLLDDLENSKIVKLKGVFGLFKASSAEDDIRIFDKDNNLIETFNMFRQQKEK